MTGSLDDRSFVLRNDPKGMYDLTVDFPDQCRRALVAAREQFEPPVWEPPANVVVSGMGGSAAGGDFLRALIQAQGTAPCEVVRDYTLPHYVGLGTLLFAVSYSGNTEETLAAYDQARKAGAHIVVVTSGGRLGELAREHGHPLVTIPGGQPPRTALGYLLIPLLWASARLGLLPEPAFEPIWNRLEEGRSQWEMARPEEDNAAKKLARLLHGKLPILYGLGAWQAACANRWKGQIDENAKVLCFTHAFPELNHNEVLGWVAAQTQSVRDWAVVYLQDGRESAKIRRRAEVTRQLIQDRTPVYQVYALGEELLEKMLCLVYMGDFVSLYMAALNGVDPENIDWLNHLKAELAKVD